MSEPSADETEKEGLGEIGAGIAATRSGQITLELLRNARCPACDGSGAIQVQTGSREYVTHEMALDAGDPSMEGSLYREEEYETQQCQWCYERAVILSETDGKTEDASGIVEEIIAYFASVFNEHIPEAGKNYILAALARHSAAKDREIQDWKDTAVRSEKAALEAESLVAALREDKERLTREIQELL